MRADYRNLKSIVFVGNVFGGEVNTGIWTRVEVIGC